MMKPKRWALPLAAALSAGVLTGCPPVPPKDSATQPATRLASSPGSKLPDAPILGTAPVAKGVYVAVDWRQPLSDQALVRARMSRSEVLAAVTAKPSATQGAATQAAGGAQELPQAADPRAAEPPPESVKLYLQGRQRFLEGSNSDAMTALEKALQLDPQGFTVLRLMGRVCFAGNQLARGAMYLERAQHMRPQDVEVNYLLGRYWLERNDYDQAVYFLMQAEDSPERLITSTHTPLSAFYLGIALQLGGYHLAAAKEYEHFLEVSELPIPGYRYDAELSYLINMHWASHLAAAENFARLGDYHAALPHYKSAGAARPDDAFIGSRLVNALVHDGQMVLAKNAALTLVSATRGSEDAVKLLGWTYQAAGRQADPIADLRAHLKTAPGLTGATGEQAAAVTLSATQEYLGHKMDALRTLADFLDQHPTNMEVLGRLLKRVNFGDEFAIGLRAATAAIAADRANSPAVWRLFAPVAEGRAGAMYMLSFRPGFRGIPPAPVTVKKGSEFALYYLEGLTRQAQNEPAERVAESFEAAVKADGEFFPAAQAYVSFLLTEEKFDQAATIIGGLMKANASSPRTWQLQVESEAAQQRLVQALKLAQEARTRFPNDVEVRMQLVGVYRLRGQDKEADAETQTIIKDMPKHEPAYRSLVNSLFLQSRQGANINAALTTIVAALNKMSVELPDSRFGRVASAIIFARGGRYEDAETILRTVLAVEPDEPDALVTLAQVVALLNRHTESITLLESALKRKAQLEVVRMLAALYRDQDRKPEAVALVKRYAEENPDSESYLLLYAAELDTQDTRSQAITVLTGARAKFPRSQTLAAELAKLQDKADDHEGAVATMRDFMKENGETTDRLYLLAHFHSSTGNDDASVAALQRVLAIMPDHIGANNDLGYFWINAGIHLEQAEPMIRKALENKPDDPAFLDSLAWLYYKQGKFAEAAALLQKALALPNGTAPEVVQHLGDTLYRMGRLPDAIEEWARALQLLALTKSLSTADLKVREYLTRAVTEAKAGRRPEISPILDTDKSKAAGPATTPATMPQ